jgi:hypothetical protein
VSENRELERDAEVEELWAEEAERRWREIESGAVETIPWEEVREKLSVVSRMFQKHVLRVPAHPGPSLDARDDGGVGGARGVANVAH